MAKIGSEHFAAWLRQGLRELRAVFYPDSNVAQQPEYGLYGTKTPGEVAEDRHSDGRDLEDERPREQESVLGSRTRPSDDRGGRDGRGMDLDR